MNETEAAPVFIDVLPQSTSVSLLPWIGLFLCALATVVLGILSLLHARRSLNNWPLATKLLLLVNAWTLLMGLTGFTQGVVFTFETMKLFGVNSDARWPMLFLNLGQPLNPPAAALIIILTGLPFLCVTVFLRQRATRT